jgi:hypothetical protein
VASDGYGICTGIRSGIFVVDLDGVEAIEAFAAMGPIPRTFTVCRGSERGHLYFRHPGFPVRNSVKKLGPCIDIKGDGGMVVGPGSPHETGMVYEIADDAPVVEAPPWLLDWDGLRKEDHEPGARPEPVVAGSPEEATRIAEAIAFLADAEPAISGQRGHVALWHVAQTLVRTIELPIATCAALIWEHYNDRCDPPWSDREIAHKLQQARDHGRFETRSEVERFNARLLATGVRP